MRVIVKNNEGLNLRLPIPSGLILNRFIAGVVQKYLKEYGLNVSKAQAAAFIKELNRYRRRHPEWVLVEAETADGDYGKVKL